MLEMAKMKKEPSILFIIIGIKEFKQKWFDDAINYHRTVSTYINTLIDAGFNIKKILEPMPDDNLIESRPECAVHKIRPPLLVIASLKNEK